MQHDNLHNDFTNLISRYLSGNTNDAEMRQLEDWVLQSPENRQQFQTSKKAWILTQNREKISDVKVEQLWTDTSKQLFKESKVVEIQPRNNRRIFMRLAAAIALLATVGLWIFSGAGVEQPVAATTTETSKKVELPDGSQIVLNRGSQLSYSPEGKNLRKVELDGDAFFDVKKDKSRPFVISAKEIEIEVLGTSFYVDCRKQQKETQVTVLEGSVAVRFEGKEEILKAGEKAVFKRFDRTLSKKSNEDKNFDFLKTNSLAFENAPMDKVIFDINRLYHSNISIEKGTVENCELTSNFKDKSLEAVVKIIERSLSIKSTQTENGIIFSGVCE